MMPKTIANFSVFLVLTFAWLGGFSNPLNAQGPENVLVVVNADSQDSLAVANHYIHLRQIPARNVLYLHGITTSKKHGKQSSDSKSFKREILDPILKAIETRGLEKQIDCIAYSAGFPTRININPLIETHLKQTGRKRNGVLHAPWSSITSLTYFNHNAFGARPDFFNLDANHFANPRGFKVFANPFTGQDASRFKAALESANAGNVGGAIEGLVQLARTHREQISVIYSLARCFAATGSPKKAIALLNHAREIGFASKSMLKSDRAFSAMNNTPAFEDIVNALEDLPDGVAPSRSFSATKFWAINGWANGNAQQGDRYMLSSVLAVVNKDASTLKAALVNLQSSVTADGTQPDGNVYFSATKDVRSRVRKIQFEPAKRELESLGRKVKIIPHVTPQRDLRVIGATLGRSAIEMQKSGSGFAPGAICDNLTSYGALWGIAHTKVSEYLDQGAAGATGTVCEPKAIAAKFPNARWHAHYARGCTLAESLFQSVSGPSQLLLVGDPLCCPFGKFPKFEIMGIADGQTVEDDFVLQVIHHPKSPGVRYYAVFVDGLFSDYASDPQKIDVATEAMSDGYHEIRIAAISNFVIANTHSEKTGFVLNRDGQQLTLEVPKTVCNLDQIVLGKAASTTAGKIHIEQNLRPVGTVDKQGRFSIRAAKLGLGQTKLQAVSTLPDGRLVKSKPISVTITR